MRLVVLASGRGSNLQAILEAIESGVLQCEVLAVVSDNPNALALERARGRGIPGIVVARADYARRADYDAGLAKRVKAFDPDLVVLAGFMRVLGTPFLQAFEGRIINIHPSLLPSFPGLDAQKQALEYGVKYSGCTVHFVDRGVDTGPIIAQRVVPVLKDDDVHALSERILEQEHELIVQAIATLASGQVTISGRRVIIG